MNVLSPRNVTLALMSWPVDRHNTLIHCYSASGLRQHGTSLAGYDVTMQRLTSRGVGMTGSRNQSEGEQYADDHEDDSGYCSGLVRRLRSRR